MKASLIYSEIYSEIKACLHLAIPLAAAQVAQAGTNFADTVMMGLLGTQIIAAGGLGSVTYSVLVLVSTGIVSSVSIFGAMAFSQGDIDGVRRITNQGLWLALFLSLPLMILVANFSPILQLFGQNPSNISLAQIYLNAILWGFPASISLAVLRSILTALNHAKIITIIVFTGVVFNIIGNYVLMFGKLGFPALGLAGIAWASTVTYWLMLLAAIIYLCKHPGLKKYQFFREWKNFNQVIFSKLMKTGLPIGGLYIFEAGLFATTAFLMGTLGTIPLAAHQIALQTAAISFMVPVGISLATTVRVGQSIGQNDPKAAQLAGGVAIAIGASFMALMALILWFFPQQIVRLYIDIKNPENKPVIDYAISLLRIAAIFQVVDGIQAIAGGALRGLKDTKIPMFIGIFSYWCIGFIFGLILCFYYQKGGVGLWIGLATGLAFTALILTWRFKHLINLHLGKLMTDN